MCPPHTDQLIAAGKLIIPADQLRSLRDSVFSAPASPTLVNTTSSASGVSVEHAFLRLSQEFDTPIERDRSIRVDPTAAVLSPHSGSWPHFLRPAREAIAQASNRDVAERASRVLDAIQELPPFVRSIPKLHAAELDDESMAFEWALKDRRVGFVIDKEPAESSWFVASRGSDFAYGRLAEGSIASLVAFLVSNLRNTL